MNGERVHLYYSEGAYVAEAIDLGWFAWGSSYEEALRELAYALDVRRA